MAIERHATAMYEKVTVFYGDFIRNKKSTLHVDAANIMEFRYHHICQLLGRFRLFIYFSSQYSSIDNILALAQSPINVVTLSLQYGSSDNGSDETKYTWLYGCKFPFEYAVECVFKACLYFVDRHVPAVGLTELRQRVLTEQSSYLPISSEARRWLEAGFNGFY